MSQRACSNPLCEHFLFMVKDDIPFFARLLKEELPSPGELSAEIPEIKEINSIRLDRIVRKWVIAPKDQYDFHPVWCAKYVWQYSYEINAERLTEWYYFCTECDAVLRGVDRVIWDDTKGNVREFEVPKGTTL